MKTLYHGTSSVNLDCIKAIGLVPGHAKGGDVWAKEHHMDLAEKAKKREPSVFVAEARDDAEEFARIAVEEVGGDPIIITLHVPEKEFKTFVIDELFSQGDKEHAWRAHSVPPSCIGEVLPVEAKPPVMSLLMSLAAALQSLQRKPRKAFA